MGDALLAARCARLPPGPGPAPARRTPAASPAAGCGRETGSVPAAPGPVWRADCRWRRAPSGVSAGMMHLPVMRARRQGRPAATSLSRTHSRERRLSRTQVSLRHRHRRRRHRRPGAGLRAGRRTGRRGADCARRSRASSRAAPPGRDIRAWALSAGSKRLLDCAGRLAALAEHAQPVTAVDITNSSLDDAFRPVLVDLRQHRRRRRAGDLHRREASGCNEALLQAAGTASIGRAASAAAPIVGLRSQRARRAAIALEGGSQPAAAAARGRRRPRLAPARGGRHQGRGLELSTDRHRHHGAAREAAWRPRRAAFPARRARSPSCR